VRVDRGDAPSGAQVVTDRMNARTGRYSGAPGDALELLDRAGKPRTFKVTGRGDTLAFSQFVAQQHAVLYAPQSGVNALAGATGVDSIELRVRDPKRASAIGTVVRSRLLAMKPHVTFPTLADVRPAGQWPGEETFNNFATLLYVG